MFVTIKVIKKKLKDKYSFKKIISFSPMHENFTLLILSQYYPVSQHYQVITFKDMSIDTDIADFLQSAEQQVSQQVMDRINEYASIAVQRTI